MPFNLFYTLLILLTFLCFLFWLIFYNPVRRIRNALKNTVRSLKIESDFQKNSTFFMQSGFQMFKNKKLMKIWDEYLKSIFVEKNVVQYSNIKEYFSMEKTVEGITNTSLASFVPIMLMTFGFVFDSAFLLYHQYKGILDGNILFQAAVAGLYVILLSLFMAVYNKSIIYRVRKQIDNFTNWISQQNNEITSINEQLGDLRFTMHTYQEEQLKFYARLTDHIAENTQKVIEPYLVETRTIIENFVTAATERHIESMEHLAEYFVTNTTQLYIEQIEKLSETTSSMAQIQNQTAETLKSVTTIYTESKDCIQLISDTSSNTLVRYDTYLEKVESMNVALISSVRQLEDLVDYIRINSRNQNFTIENLTKFQQDLIDVSDRSANSMKTFFDDFNDQYSSSIIALRAASNDIMRASDLLKGSYTQMADDITVDVNKVFITFEENLATISVHLSQSIQDLQDAIDELPGILKRIPGKKIKYKST